MRKINAILLLEFWIVVFVVLAIVVLFETDVLPVGVLADENNVEFIASAVMQIVTLCSIPVALKLFRFKVVKNSLCGENPAGGLRLWASVRLSLLAVPMIANTLLYYIFVHAGFAYMAIILFLSLFFVYPSMTRCLNETGNNNSKL